MQGDDWALEQLQCAAALAGDVAVKAAAVSASAAAWQLPLESDRQLV